MIFLPVKESMSKALYYFDKSRMLAEVGDLKDSFVLADRSAAFEAAMEYLIGVQVGGGEPGSSAELADFRSQVVSRIDADQEGLSIYIYKSLDCVVTGRLEEAMVHRSALQLLLVDYPGADAFLDDQDREWLEEMDDELREKVAKYGDEIQEYPVLRGLPAAHWWWPFLAGS